MAHMQWEIPSQEDKIIAWQGKRIAELERIVKNIEIHFEHLCDEDMRQHGYISIDHDIDFQVFRALCGYREILNEKSKLQEAVHGLLGSLSNGEFKTSLPSSSIAAEMAEKVYRINRDAVNTLMEEDTRKKASIEQSKDIQLYFWNDDESEVYSEVGEGRLITTFDHLNSNIKVEMDSPIITTKEGFVTDILIFSKEDCVLMFMMPVDQFFGEGEKFMLGG